MRHSDKYNTPREGLKMGLELGICDPGHSYKGRYIIHITDIATGRVLDHRDQSETVVAGVPPT